MDEDNLKPVANPDAADVAAGDAVEIDVLRNDEDEDGVVRGVVILEEPGIGDIELIDSGVVTYSAPFGPDAIDSFFYAAVDDDGAESEPVEVTIGIAGAEPPPDLPDGPLPTEPDESGPVVEPLPGDPDEPVESPDDEFPLTPDGDYDGDGILDFDDETPFGEPEEPPIEPIEPPFEPGEPDPGEEPIAEEPFEPIDFPEDPDGPVVDDPDAVFDEDEGDTDDLPIDADDGAPEDDDGTDGASGAPTDTVDVTFVGGDAEFDNSLGYYFREGGAPTGEAYMLFDGVDLDEGLVELTASFELATDAEIGFFLIRDGGNLGVDLSDGSVRVDDKNRLVHEASDGTETTLQRYQTHFDDPSLNRDGAVQVEFALEDSDEADLVLNQFWEDKAEAEGSYDGDFDDAFVRIVLNGTGSDDLIV